MAARAPTAGFDFPTSTSLLDRSQAALAMGVSSGMRRAEGLTLLFFEQGERPSYLVADGHRRRLDQLQYRHRRRPLHPFER